MSKLTLTKEIRSMRNSRSQIPTKANLFLCVVVLFVAVNQTHAQSRDDIDTANKFYQQESWDEAETAFARLVQANPRNGEYLFKLARSCVQLKKYDTSNSHYLDCLGTGYEKGKTVYGLAANYSMLGIEKDALKWLITGLGLPKSITYQDLMTDENFEFIRTSSEYAKLVPRLDDKQSREDRWKTDIQFARHAMETIHFDVFRNISEAQWDREFNAIQDHLHQLSDSEIIMKLTRIVASVGDGHTFVQPPTGGDLSFHFFPLQIYQFKEGIFVTSADKTNELLVGQKLVEISGVEISDVLRQLAPLLSVDNEMGLKENVKLVLFAEFLNEIGILEGNESCVMTFEDNSGKRTTTTLRSGPFDPAILTATLLKPNDGLPLYLSHPSDFYWSKHLKNLNATYLQINLNYSPPGKSLTDFYDSLFEQIERDDVRNLIIDIRNCPGGNSFLNKELIKHILQNEKINKRGALYTIIGRRTFSAAMNLATDLENWTETTFIGEPTGSSPNFVGETNFVALPNSKLQISISDAYWQRSVSWDVRKWIAPEIYFEPSFGDFAGQTDPVLGYLEKILTAPASTN